MAKRNLLTTLRCRSATCPDDKPSIDLADGGNLYLRIYRESDTKSFFCRLSRDRKYSNRGIGGFPEVSLKEARDTRDTFKKLWAQGIDPSVEKQKSKLTINKSNQLTFEHAYQQALNNRIVNLSDGHKKRWRETYAKYLKSPLGRLPLIEVDDEVVLTVLENIYKIAPSTAQKAKHQISVIFTYAKEKKWYRGSNPCSELTGNSLITPPKPQHFKYLKEKRVGEFLHLLQKSTNEFVKTFLYVILLTALRSGSLRRAQWSWYDSQSGVLNIPSNAMKSREAFICPLPAQAIQALDKLRILMAGEDSDYIFAGQNDRETGEIKPISDNTGRQYLQKIMGDKSTVHGFRTLWNRVVSNMGQFTIEVIEAQLTHAFTQTNIRKTYLGGENFLEKRRDVVQAYADWCDKQLKIYKSANRTV
jgi:integrase